MKKETVRAKDFKKKLAAYSATAGAALLGAPVSVHATAGIQDLTTFSYNNGSAFVTTAPNLTVTAFTNQWMDKTFTAATANHHAGFNGFFALYHGANNRNSAGLDGGAHAGAAVQAGQSFITNLAPGVAIGAHTFKSFAYFGNRTHSGVFHGQFLPAGASGAATGYVEFKNVLGGQTYYGWLRVEVAKQGGFIDQISLIDQGGNGIYGAFENKNAPNFANFKVGEIATVPEPAIGGLALIALGAAGVREMRRRRNARKI